MKQVPKMSLLGFKKADGLSFAIGAPHTSPNDTQCSWEEVRCAEVWEKHHSIGITTTKSPVLDIAALCLSLWPAAISAQMLTFVSSSASHSEQLT